EEDDDEMEEWLEGYKVKEWQEEAGFEEIEDEEISAEESEEEEIVLGKVASKCAKQEKRTVRSGQNDNDSDSPSTDDSEDDSCMFGEENAYSFGLDDYQSNAIIARGRRREMKENIA